MAYNYNQSQQQNFQQQPQFNYEGRNPTAYENKNYDQFQVNFSQSNGSFHSLDQAGGFQGQQHQSTNNYQNGQYQQQQQQSNWGFQENNANSQFQQQQQYSQQQQSQQQQYQNGDNLRESAFQYQNSKIRESQSQQQQYQQQQQQQYQEPLDQEPQDISQFPEKPVQLIEVIQNEQFRLTQEAKEILELYEGNVAFVALAGKYRTGKSYLLNKLLGIQGRGFKVDEGTGSCTQGIWMWSKPIRNKDGLNIFFIDTEGSSSVEKNSKHDAKVFALAILMSSFFVFNSVGCIDENAMSQLILTTSISKNIAVSQYGGKKDQGKLSQYAPRFLWILRDFVLQIQNEFNKDITPNEYMENALLNDTQSSKTKKIRQSLCEFFKHRECVTMVRPIENEQQIQRLDSVPDNMIRRQFLEKIDYIRQQLMGQTEVKRVNGQPLNARMFVSMVESFVEKINEKHGIPSIATAWEAIVEKECQQAHQEAQDMYLEILQERLENNLEKSMSYWELFLVLRETRDQAINQFENVGGIKEKNEGFQKYLSQLKEFITQKEGEIIAINDNLADKTCGEVLDKSFFELKMNISNRKDIYTLKNIEEFHQDFNYSISQYNKQYQGPRKSENLIQFLKQVERPMVKALISTMEVQNENQYNYVSAKDIQRKELLQDLKSQLNLKQQVFERKKDNQKRWQQKVQLEKNQIDELKRQLQKSQRNGGQQMDQQQFKQVTAQLKQQIQKLEHQKNQVNGAVQEKKAKGFRVNQNKLMQSQQMGQQQQQNGRRY